MCTAESKSSVQRHSFILKCVSTFMYRTIEKRQKFMSDLKVREANANNHYQFLINSLCAFIPNPQTLTNSGVGSVTITA